MDSKQQQVQKAEALRAMHLAPPILALPNAWDVASARVFEEAGARAIATTSPGIANALGYPDGEKIPREEMLSAVARIVRAVSVPVTADVEAGYGPSPRDVEKTVSELAQTGAVGLNLEDSPRDSAQPLFDVSLQVERIRAARQAANRAGVPLVINARTDVFLAQVGTPESQLSEAVRRANAYRKAGADSLFVPGVTDAPTISLLVREIRGPLNVLAGRGMPPVTDLQKLGVARLSVGSGLMRAALGFARNAARELFEQGSYTLILENPIPYDELNRLMRPQAKQSSA
jgi:2-methylisocitrate lyase-like PEP mutase family enzyme